MALRVAVSGTGSMGRLVLLAIEDVSDLEVVGVLELYSSGDRYTLPSGANVPLRQAVDRIGDLRAEVVVGFHQRSLDGAVAARRDSGGRATGHRHLRDCRKRWWRRRKPPVRRRNWEA